MSGWDMDKWLVRSGMSRPIRLTHRGGRTSGKNIGRLQLMAVHAVRRRGLLPVAFTPLDERVALGRSASRIAVCRSAGLTAASNIVRESDDAVVRRLPLPRRTSCWSRARPTNRTSNVPSRDCPLGHHHIRFHGEEGKSGCGPPGSRVFVFPQCVHVWTGYCATPTIGPQVWPRSKHRSFMAAFSRVGCNRQRAAPEMALRAPDTVGHTARTARRPRHRGSVSWSTSVVRTSTGAVSQGASL
jgi:hypothetical protein